MGRGLKFLRVLLVAIILVALVIPISSPFIVEAAGAWVSPTSDTPDPTNPWASPTNAYDGDTATMSYRGWGRFDALGWSPYLVLNHSVIVCDKVRVWATISATSAVTKSIEVDVYYSGAWDNIYSGALTEGAYVEYPIGSSESVTSMRIRGNWTGGSVSGQIRVFEAGFYSVYSAPSIDALAVSNKSVTTARLNSQITDDGGATGACEVRFGYGTTELLNIGTCTNNTGTATGSPIDLSGGFTEAVYRTTTVVVTGAGTFNVVLPAGVTGTATSGTATVTDSPKALAAGATTVVDTGATTGNFTILIANTYDTVESFSGTWSTNSFPTSDITGLIANTAYYYRVQVKNGHSTTTSPSEITFTTYTNPTLPLNVQASPLSTSILLNWSIGAGSSRTLVRFALDKYPTTTAEGTSIYFGTENAYIHTGLALGTTYYYSLWGENGGGTYSATYASIAMTTTASGATSTGFNSISNPTDYDITDPDAKIALLSNLEPFYSLTNNFVSSWGMTTGGAWSGIFAFLLVVICLIIYIRTGSVSGALVVMLVGLILGRFIGIISGWWILFGLCGFLGSLALPKREG